MPTKKIEICAPELSVIEKIKNEPGSDIYLCGGGKFAGWLLENEKIDILKIKLNPLILGDGIELFGGSKKEVKTELIDSRVFDNSLQIIEYQIKY